MPAPWEPQHHGDPPVDLGAGARQLPVDPTTSASEHLHLGHRPELDLGPVGLHEPAGPGILVRVAAVDRQQLRVVGHEEVGADRTDVHADPSAEVGVGVVLGDIGGGPQRPSPQLAGWTDPA